MVCYCKREMPDGVRRIHFAVSVDWGMKDLRADWQGTYDFCSFKCVAEWAADRAAAHDAHVVTDGVDEMYGNELPGGGALS